MSRILYFVIFSIFSLQSCITQDTISSQAQFKSDTTAISNFVKSNDPEAIKVNTGFWYSIDALKNGIYPALSDSVTLSYTAKLITNTSTDISSLQVVDDTTTTVLLSNSISGFQQGLIFFPAGSYGQLYIPSGLAFGVSAHKKGKIPPNANLLYEVKLISVKGFRLTTDLATIDSYLASLDTVPLYDDSGIRYTVDNVGNAAGLPQVTDSLLVTYTEKILTADTLISSVNIPTKVALKDQVTCWRIMLPKYYTEGTTITMYVPSGYAYGSFGSFDNSIPVNTNMVYQVTLIKIFPH